MTIEIQNEAQFGDAIRNGDSLVIFSAQWCGPCKSLHKELQMAKNRLPSLRVIEVDIDRFPRLVQAYSLRKVPTLVFFRTGIELRRREGLISDSEILRLVQG